MSNLLAGMLSDQSMLRLTGGVPGEDDDDLGDPTRLPPEHQALSLIKVKAAVCPDLWGWNHRDCSPEVDLHGKDTACFHPHWSNGTAGVRAERPLTPGAVHYWEVHLGERVYGTSLMVGVSTRGARLHCLDFKCVLGEDGQGWGLSHRGRVHHAGKSHYYCKPFTEYTPVVVGVLVEAGTISFYKDGVSLGEAFSGLEDVSEPVYPTCTSTAAKTVMTLGLRLRTLSGLQDWCRLAVRARLELIWPGKEDRDNAVSHLPLPPRLKDFLRHGL